MVSYSAENKSTENSYERGYLWSVSFQNCINVQYSQEVLKGCFTWHLGGWRWVYIHSKCYFKAHFTLGETRHQLQLHQLKCRRNKAELSHWILGPARMPRGLCLFLCKHAVRFFHPPSKKKLPSGAKHKPTTSSCPVPPVRAQGCLGTEWSATALSPLLPLGSTEWGTALLQNNRKRPTGFSQVLFQDPRTESGSSAWKYESKSPRTLWPQMFRAEAGEGLSMWTNLADCFI